MTKNIMAIWKEFNPQSNKSIKSDFKTESSHKKNMIIEYLNSGKIKLVSTSRGIDVLTGENISRNYYILTDGEFSWANTLAYYVNKYNLALPAEFEARILHREIPAAYFTI